jgi:hypothetical protein
MRVTMKIHFSLLIGLVTAGACLGGAGDSSALIFNDQVVNDYRITFYQSDWDSVLVFNKDNDEIYMPARFRWRGPDGDSIVLDSIGVRYKGNSSYQYAGASPKKPLKFYFNKYRKEQLFYGIEKLNFSNIIKDPSFMREKLAYDVLKKYMPAPRASFATISLEDRLIRGLYTQVEQVDEQFLDRHFGGHKYNLYKAADQGAFMAFKGFNLSNYETEYELKTNETKNDWSGLINMLDTLNNTPDADFVRVVGKRLDLDNCIRYLAFNMVNANFDSYTGSGRNFYLYDDQKAGAFKLIPWDVNLSFGAYEGEWKNNVAAVDAFAPSNLDKRPLENRILSNDSLKRVYAGYMKKMIEGPLCADSISIAAYRLKSVIDSSVKADVAKFDFTYEHFCASIDTEVVIQKGTVRTIYFGLRSFTALRNSAVNEQIEKALPVIQNPSARASSPALLQCKGSASGMKIRYYVPMAGAPVTIQMYNARGESVRLLIKGVKNRGFYTLNFNTHALSAGYYMILLRAGNSSTTAGIFLIN